MGEPFLGKKGSPKPPPKNFNMRVGQRFAFPGPQGFVLTGCRGFMLLVGHTRRLPGTGRGVGSRCRKGTLQRAPTDIRRMSNILSCLRSVGLFERKVSRQSFEAVCPFQGRALERDETHTAAGWMARSAIQPAGLQFLGGGQGAPFFSKKGAPWSWPFLQARRSAVASFFKGSPAR